MCILSKFVFCIEVKPSPLGVDPATLAMKKLDDSKKANEKESPVLSAQVLSKASIKPSPLAVDPVIMNARKLVDYELTDSSSSYVEFESTTSSFLLNVNSYCNESANPSRAENVPANEEESIGIDVTEPDYDSDIACSSCKTPETEEIGIDDSYDQRFQSSISCPSSSPPIFTVTPPVDAENPRILKKLVLKQIGKVNAASSPASPKTNGISPLPAEPPCARASTCMKDQPSPLAVDPVSLIIKKLGGPLHKVIKVDMAYPTIVPRLVKGGNAPTKATEKGGASCSEANERDVSFMPSEAGDKTCARALSCMEDRPSPVDLDPASLTMKKLVGSLHKKTESTITPNARAALMLTRS